MKTRKFLGVVLIAAMIASVAAAAFAVGTLAVTPSKLTVTYPHSAKLRITTPSALMATITVQARSASVDWHTIRSIPAARAALGTTFTVYPMLKVNSGIRVMQADMTSDVVTVSVKALLSPLQVTQKHRALTIRGSIMPAHVVRTPITVHVWQMTMTGKGRARHATLTALPDLTGTVYKSNRGQSWWKAPFTAPAKATYVFKAFHSDVDHVGSWSKAKIVKIKWLNAPKLKGKK